MLLLSGARSRKWVARLPAVVYALNNEVTRLTGLRPADAIKKKSVVISPAAPAYRPVGLKEQKLPSNVIVRYLYQPGELEGGQHRRATDPIWSLDVYRIERAMTKDKTPVVYYLMSGPARGFVREELQVVPFDTELPTEIN